MFSGILAGANPPVFIYANPHGWGQQFSGLSNEKEIAEIVENTEWRAVRNCLEIS